MPVDGQIIAAIKRAAPSIEHRVSKADMEVIVTVALAYSAGTLTQSPDSEGGV